MDGRGNVLLPLDEAAVRALAPKLKAKPASRRSRSASCTPISTASTSGARARSWRELLPGVSISLSSEVSPEIREYERFSTTCANAYVQPLMDRYLGRLRRGAAPAAGFACPLLLMTSGGGLADARDGARFPIRLVESGPAGGAILVDRRWRDMRPRPGPVASTWAARPPRSASSTTASRSTRAASRSTRQLPLPEGQRPAGAHPGDRDGRDRRRRRLDRRASIR